MIKGVIKGNTGVFGVTWNGAMQPGQQTAWTCDTPDVTLAGSGDQVSVTVPGDESVTQFVLTATGTNSDGKTVTATANVPVLMAAATGGVIDQIS